uniref:Uncharacterized protein n=1 Tax=Trichobilharzia regenti TaxID=157069 RepID=A0AA85KH71_TRIRE|nr:unnamed protein product [Trichobilharzia regenti]CAH8848438.1 unnamed protein product [Trichobilharzia regenti]
MQAAAHVKLVGSGFRIFLAAFTIAKVIKLGVDARRSNRSNAKNSNTQPKAENLVDEAAFGVGVLGRAFSKAAQLEIALCEIAALFNPFTSKKVDKQAESKVVSGICMGNLSPLYISPLAVNLVDKAAFRIGVLGRAFSKAAGLEIALCEIAALFNPFTSKIPDEQPESKTWRTLEKVALVTRLYVLGSTIFSGVKTGFISHLKSAKA